MSDHGEPEKYSIDEMMERLKSRPSEEPIENGQLVTRSDGSQAIRVRKRKRRSHQPHKEELSKNRRARMLQVSGALILLLLAAFAAGAAVVYANSAPFRDGLVRKIAQVTGADVELLRFRMNPSSANADAINLTWPAGGVLDALAVRGIRAQIAPQSFLGKSMSGEEVAAQAGTLQLRLPTQPKAPRSSSDADSAAILRFRRYAISKLNVGLGDSSAPLMKLWNSEASLQMSGSTPRPMLLLNRGDLSIDGWPKLTLDRAHIEFRGSQVDLLGMLLRYNADERGAFKLNGSISPHDSSRASTLVVGFESYQLAGVAGPELGNLFSGRIDTFPSASSNFLTFTPGNLTDSSLVAEFKNSVTSPFEVNGFPFLADLSRLLDDVWFSRPVFEGDVRGVIRRSNGSVTLSSLSMASKARMAMTASVTVAKDRRISGEIEVGIAEAMVKAAKNPALELMFAKEREGFRWATLKVSGGVGAPADNFRALYEAATAGGAAPEAKQAPGFEELTRPR
jgi:hypothetical protein